MDSPKTVKTHYVRCLKCSKILECSRYDTNALLDHIRTDHRDIEIVDIDEDDFNSYKSNKGNTGYRGTNGYKSSDDSKSTIQTNGYTGINGYKSANTMQYKKFPTMREAAGNIVLPRTKLNDYAEPKYKETREKFIDPTAIRSKLEDCEESKQNSASSRERLFIRSPHIVEHRNHDDDAKCDCVLHPERSNDKPSVTRRCNVNTSPSQTPRANQPNRSLFRNSIEKWRPANGTLYCPKCGANCRPLIRTQAERSANNSCCAACILSCWPFCFLPFLVPSTNNREYLHCSNCKTFLGLYDRSNNCVRPNREFVQPEDMHINETPEDDCKEPKKCRCA
ncbi:uncharacterized protein [Eurosta solidaginis]|uniref:uncharacterized protein n=1 Tax=Eurosta solidaginis TaxID=178769 RepID=UPI0035312F51